MKLICALVILVVIAILALLGTSNAAPVRLSQEKFIDAIQKHSNSIIPSKYRESGMTQIRKGLLDEATKNQHDTPSDEQDEKTSGTGEVHPLDSKPSNAESTALGRGRHFRGPSYMRSKVRMVKLEKH
mmetsp:Transcript_4434/g.16726  ORF Transcript_4434/g.16726 Transcript_4434/m.16726 type:complete len:128 (+) Transcript_4434:2271-2654(+)